MTRTLAGRQVNPIGLGCMSLSWAYGVPPGEAEALAMLNAFYLKAQSVNGHIELVVLLNLALVDRPFLPFGAFLQ